jgi:hypothetical protein
VIKAFFPIIFVAIDYPALNTNISVNRYCENILFGFLFELLGEWVMKKPAPTMTNDIKLYPGRDGFHRCPAPVI